MNRLIPKASIVALLSAGLLAAAPQAQAQQAAAPASVAPAPYEIAGFRSARFGMTQAQVRDAIAKDLPNAQIVSVSNKLEGTEALQATVPALEPGPGAANIIYIFGATSKNLSHINVMWNLAGEPSREDRESVIAAAVQLTSYFQTLPNPLKATSAATPLGPNALLMFGGVDTRGAGLEVAASGISYQTNGQEGAPANSPEPTGPATLRVSYIANVANPDVKKIARGSF